MHDKLKTIQELEQARERLIRHRNGGHDQTVRCDVINTIFGPAPDGETVTNVFLEWAIRHVEDDIKTHNIKS